MSKVKIAGKVLVIQLGREETRIVLMGKGSEILRTLVLDTPAEAVEDGMIRNPDVLREMLKTTLKQDAELKRVRQVVFSLRTSQVITETVTIPDLNPAKTEKLIQSNMDTYFPVDVRDYRIVWQTMGTREDENGSKEQGVQLWAIPNSMLNRYYQVANACGLSVAAIDYCGNSIATAAGISFVETNKGAKAVKSGFKLDLNMEIGFGAKKKKTAEPETGSVATAVKTVANTNLYVSLDKDLVGMTFAQNGRVVYQRFVPCGADPSHQFGELAMMVEYYRTLENSRGSNIRGVVVGTLADDEMLVADLQDVLGIPLGRFRGDCAPGLVFCVGAARTTMDFGNPALNKVSTARAQMATQLWQYGVVLAGGLALISVVMFTLSARLVWNMDISSLNTTKQALQVQAAKVAGFADNYYAYENNYNSYSADWETVFSSMRTYNDNLVLMLSELESIVPENSSVTSLQIAADGMNVTFACENKEEAAYLIMALRRLQYAELNSISNLSGGGGGPATSYGSGNSSNEKAPTEGSSTLGAAPAGETEGAAVEDGLKLDGAVAAFIASELTEEELREVAQTMTREDFDLLEQVYGKTPGVNPDAEEDPDAEPRKLDTLKAAYADKNAEEQQKFFDARAAALRTLLTTDPFAGNHFLDLLEEDFDRDQDALLWWVILDDIIRLQDEGKLNAGAMEDVHLMAETMDLLVDVLVQDEDHLSATEALICTDEYMELSYLYYLEVNLEMRPAEMLPWLDMDHVMTDVLDGGLKTGDEVLDSKLNGLVDEETWILVDSLDTEEGIRNLVNGYFGEGTTGNEYIDDIIDEYLANGTTGNEAVDGMMEDILASDEMTQVVDKMLNEFVTNGTTGVPALDDMINGYLSGGTTGNGQLDAIIDNYYQEVIQNMTPEQISEMLNKYLNEGSTGNPLYDELIYKYMTEGSTDIPELDKLIADYLDSLGGEPELGLTKEELAALLEKYLNEGTTGNPLYDSMIEKYLKDGTTGNPAMDKLIEEYMAGIGSGGENDPLNSISKERLEELMNLYLNNGTTGIPAYDMMIEKYIFEGTTGIPALDKLIEEFLNDMMGGGGDEDPEKPGLSKEQVAAMLEKYLKDGTTGNSLYDAMIEQYLTTGTTGNSEMDKLIEEYIEEYFNEKKVTELLENYLETGTTGSKKLDELLNKYLNEGTTGIKKLDEMIEKCMKDMLGGTGEFTPEMIGELMSKYLTTGTTGNPVIDKLIYNYIVNGTTGIPYLDKMIEEYMNSLSGNGGSGGGGLGGLGGLGGIGGGADTRIYFTVSLGYKEELKAAELARKGLYYDDKISKLEVEE